MSIAKNENSLSLFVPHSIIHGAKNQYGKGRLSEKEKQTKESSWEELRKLFCLRVAFFSAKEKQDEMSLGSSKHEFNVIELRWAEIGCWRGKESGKLIFKEFLAWGYFLAIFRFLLNNN